MPWSRVKVFLLSCRRLAFSFNNTGPTSACGSNAADWLVTPEVTTETIP